MKLLNRRDAEARRGKSLLTALSISLSASLRLCGLFLAGFALPLPAATPGSEVIVVFNNRLPESKLVADHYARKRDVPARQIVGLALPTTETMTRVEFIEQLQSPLLRFLETNSFFTFSPSTNPGTSPRRVSAASVRYAVLCYGVPLKILKDTTLVEAEATRLQPALQRTDAAVDSQLVLLPSSEQTLLWAGPLANPVYSVTNTAPLHPTNGLLIVARLDGPTPALARALVDKALEAETNGLWGRAYFDARGLTNGDYKLGDDWMRGAANVARRVGFETELDERPATFGAGFPLSQVALYAGWYDQAVSGPFTRPTVEFMPGAFAYHLYSFSARSLREGSASWAATLLAKGATCTMGSTEEPYLSGTPDLFVFLSRWSFLNFTFGEAAWAAQRNLSWQTTVIGDPLYRPFAQRPDLLHAELEQRKSPLLEWSHLSIVNRNLALGVAPAQAIAYLEALPFARQSAVLTERLGDFYSAQNKFSDALGTWEAAIKCNPSPQQRLRLYLRLAQGRTVAGPDAAALQWLQKLLQEFPDYPDALSIYRQMLPLAQKLAEKSVVETCEREIQRLAPAPPK